MYSTVAQAPPAETDCAVVEGSVGVVAGSKTMCLKQSALRKVIYDKGGGRGAEGEGRERRQVRKEGESRTQERRVTASVPENHWR